MAVKTKKAKKKGAASRSAPAATKKAKVRSAAPEKLLRKGPETEVDEEALEFIAALDAYKKERNRPFPTWSEVLHVLKELGYRKP